MNFEYLGGGIFFPLPVQSNEVRLYPISSYALYAIFVVKREIKYKEHNPTLDN